MRVLGVCIASLVIAAALPTNKLVPRQGDLEAAIYDEAIDGIALDPTIADALEQADTDDATANDVAAMDADANPLEDGTDVGGDELAAAEADPSLDPALDPAADPALDLA
ncbi:hypothetical protein IWW55_006183, partial [Coemansia sp. RSA 2706]